MTPLHFKKIIETIEQTDVDWYCKTHHRLVLNAGRWVPCVRKGNCVVGIYKRPVQQLLFVGAK